jgi:hypothetical protein
LTVTGTPESVRSTVTVSAPAPALTTTELIWPGSNVATSPLRLTWIRLPLVVTVIESFRSHHSWSPETVSTPLLTTKFWNWPVGTM